MKFEDNIIILLRKTMRVDAKLISQLNIRYSHARNDTKKLGKDNM